MRKRFYVLFMLAIVSICKLSTVTNISNLLSAELSQVAYMGSNAQEDLPVLQAVGLAACPQNADQQVKAACAFVSTKNGGEGAVKELCELIIQAQAGGG